MRAKKSLGQNFLTHAGITRDIAASALEGMTVVEVGPGKGVLTQALLEQGHRVVAIEKDHRLIAALQEKFAPELGEGRLVLHEGDALEIEQYLEAGDYPFQVVANLPYYITGYFLRTTLELEKRPEQMILLLQKEVVERIIAQDGKESLLSLSVKAFGQVSSLFSVPARYFSPAPKVDSAVLKIADISDQRFTEAGVAPRQFFAVLKQAFASKRKTLRNNLKHAGYEEELIAQALKKCGLDEKVRAEDLPLETWFCLAQIIEH